MTRLRNYFLTGLLVAGPAGITVYLTWSMVSWIDSWVKPYLPAAYNPDTYLSFRVPGYGLVVAILVITLIGFLTANIVGASIFSFSEELVERMPLVRNLYKGLKQIFSSVLADKGNAFKQAALVRFPHPGIWTIGFIAGTTRGEIAERLEGGDDMLTVYVPTTPNPTGGYLVFIRREDVILLDMTVEDAAKYVISFGLVTAQSADAAEGLIRSLSKGGARQSVTTGESERPPHSVQEPS
ncbi:MAG: hypothetical protein H6Q99_1781 [Proteobacteria bacterium]|nr:hypothetical protein [Pseudomonadota bacterium]